MSDSEGFVRGVKFVASLISPKEYGFDATRTAALLVAIDGLRACSNGQLNSYNSPCETTLENMLQTAIRELRCWSNENSNKGYTFIAKLTLDRISELGVITGEET